MPRLKTPLVTVFIPAFNAEAFIDDAVMSVRRQTLRDIELLIVDDGSQDGTPARLVAHQRMDPRICVVTHKHNLGRVAARNCGLDLARGQFVAMLDADDYSRPDRLACQVAYLRRHPKIDVLASEMTSVDSVGRHLNTRRNHAVGRSPVYLAALMLFKFPVIQSSVMARACAFDGYRYDAAYEGVEDYELWTRMSRSRDFAVVSPAVSTRREHPAQVSRTDVQRVTADALAVYKRELAALGVEANELDLRRHRFLRQGRAPYKAEFGNAMDRDYLAWARAWLEQLADANSRSHRYEHAAFCQLLGETLAFVCRKTATEVGYAHSLRTFISSPLARKTLRAS